MSDTAGEAGQWLHNETSHSFSRGVSTNFAGCLPRTPHHTQRHTLIPKPLELEFQVEKSEEFG